MYALEVEVTAIEAIDQILNIVKKIALCTTRLIIYFDLIDQASTLNMKIRIYATT